MYYGKCKAGSGGFVVCTSRIVNISFTTQTRLLKKGGSTKPELLFCECIII